MSSLGLRASVFSDFEPLPLLQKLLSDLQIPLDVSPGSLPAAPDTQRRNLKIFYPAGTLEPVLRKISLRLCSAGFLPVPTPETTHEIIRHEPYWVDVIVRIDSGTYLVHPGTHKPYTDGPCGVDLRIQSGRLQQRLTRETRSVTYSGLEPPRLVFEWAAPE